MKRESVALIATILVALSTMDTVFAAQRGAPPARSDLPRGPEARRDQAKNKMEAWLRRLVGRYYMFDRITIGGTLKKHFKDGKWPNGVLLTGFMDCVGVGSGPGVLCMQYNVWRQSDQQESYRVEAIFELGLDPNAAKVRLLMALNSGWQESIGESTAELVGDTVRWQEMPCNRESENLDCQRTLQISQSADLEYSIWVYGSRINLPNGPGQGGPRLVAGAGKHYMYRLSPDDGNGPDGLPRIMTDPDLDMRVDGIPRSPRPR